MEYSFSLVTVLDTMGPRYLTHIILPAFSISGSRIPKTGRTVQVLYLYLPYLTLYLTVTYER